MARRQLDALLGHQIEEWVMQRRRDAVHRSHDAFIGLRAGDGTDLRISSEDRPRFGSHATGDDHLAILAHRGTNSGKRFRLGAVEKPAGIDDHRVSAFVMLGDVIALSAQLRDDALGIDQRLGAAERDKRDFWWC